MTGSQHHHCDGVPPRLCVGDALRLLRQPGNPHDPRANEVFWREYKLGYPPRLDNAAASSLLDCPHALAPKSLALTIRTRHGSR